MSITDIVERVRREPPYKDPNGIFADKRYVCTVFDPVPWNQDDVERQLGVDVPLELATLWNCCGGLILYEDNMHHQWGLILPAPSDPDLLTLNREYREDWTGSVLPGDLIFGRFCGERERAMIRCDKANADYGSIMIVADIDPRDEWYNAANSLEEFLARFMEARVKKYWDYHYQKELAEKAALEAQRNK